MVAFSWFVVVCSALLAGVCAVLLVPIVINLIVSTQRNMQIKGRLSGEDKTKLRELLLSDLCTNGVTLCRVPARYLHNISLFSRFLETVHSVLITRFAGCNCRALAETFLLSSLLCSLGIFVVSGQLILAIAAPCILLAFIQVRAKKWISERKNKLREQLPDALRGLGMCFMAGHSLEQAFDQTAQECREPLRRELARTVDDLRTGSSVMESLDNLDARLDMDDMRFVSVALEIQHQTGGSMREVLETAAESMLASFDLSRSLEVQTAQARLSARVVSMLPVALVLVLSVAMEGYLATFFSSTAGFVLLLAAVAMQVAGIVIIRRILGVDLR